VSRSKWAFAVAAALFLLAAFGVGFGPAGFVPLGLAFMALGFLL